MLYFEVVPKGKTARALLVDEPSGHTHLTAKLTLPDKMWTILTSTQGTEQLTARIMETFKAGLGPEEPKDERPRKLFSSRGSLEDPLSLREILSDGFIHVLPNLLKAQWLLATDKKHACFIISGDAFYYLQPEDHMEVILSFLVAAREDPQVYYKMVREIVLNLLDLQALAKSGKPRYTRRKIPKNTGGYRVITAPCPELKEALGGLLEFLSQKLSIILFNGGYTLPAYENQLVGGKNIRAGLPYREIQKHRRERDLKVFRPEENWYNPMYRVFDRLAESPDHVLRDRGIVRKYANFPYTNISQFLLTASTGMPIALNASYHSLSDSIIKFDLHNFYPSIKFPTLERVLKEVLGTRDDLNLDLLKFAVTDESEGLYIGNPLSPVLANLALLPVVAHLKDRLPKLGIRFTIYADDITFSRVTIGQDLIPVSNDKYFNIPYLTNLVEESLKLVDGSELRLNKKKTKRLHGKGALITGVRITDTRSLTVPRKYRNRIRAIKHKMDTGQPVYTDPTTLEGMENWANSFKPRKEE